MITEPMTYQNKLAEIKNLPAIPSIMMEVSNLLNDQTSNTAYIARSIEKDQALTLKTLSMANSSYYGLQRKISTMDIAVKILGFEHMKDIVMRLTVLEAFTTTPSKHWDRQAYLLHSLITANIAKKIAMELKYPRPGEAFTAGLLHDFGIMVIKRYFPEEFEYICDTVESRAVTYLDAELKVIGMTHQKVGEFLSDKWALPEALSSSILYHHQPLKSINPKLASMVHIADYMTQKFQIANIEWDKDLKLDGNIFSTLKFNSNEELEKFIDGFEEIIKKQYESVKHL